jgi:hypothetical protein
MYKPTKIPVINRQNKSTQTFVTCIKRLTARAITLTKARKCLNIIKIIPSSKLPHN